jgi:ATP-dependent exoDNAse (exonuclease V) beta subunit
MKASAQAVPDSRIRQRALQPDQSFLIQAPAGSGKTELLIQRYLRLLAVVKNPEEILAITFTRKAGAEMRGRIISALDSARAGAAPKEAHLQIGYGLAMAAIERDRELDWQLRRQPTRLRIGTIDAVNSRLSRRAPLSSGLNALHRIADDANLLYREAARETIGLAEENDAIGTAITTLLSHLDNQFDRLEMLIARMLARRDQWLRQTGAGLTGSSDGLRRQLESTLGELVESSLRAAHSLISAGQAAEITAVLNYAGCSISVFEPEAALVGWQDVGKFPEPCAGSLLLWRAMAEVFLTQKGQWRRRLNKRQGFPSDGKDMKVQGQRVLADLSGIDGLEQALNKVRSLPDPHYTDRQWAAVEALLIVLPYSVATLKQVFADHRETDFTEIAQEALLSLGDDDEPTELSLSLDYQVEHILLDEFQDTSRSQYELLQKLTAGWQPGSGKTIFLVGDPMQSIYRFREAEVGLFLETQKNGIGQLRPEFLRLESNFRSDPVVVDWFNRVFRNVLPSKDDAVTGAVAFSPSAAVRRSDPDAAVTWHVVPHGDREEEAVQIAQLVSDCRKRWPQGSIGILVRSRRHVAAIASQLREAGIGFTGTELETMAELGVVQDLLALTRAITHPGDRLAWLAVLRAPWCGLTLRDLHTLAGADHATCILDILRSLPRAAGLSEDGRVRLDRLREVIEAGVSRRGRLPLRDCVEAAWLELGGPATVEEVTDFELVDRFFEFLEHLDVGADCADGVELTDRLRERFVTRSERETVVEIMTMHKAKGLEFDTVILPGLGYGTKRSEQPLLLWHELAGPGSAHAGEGNPLVIAPIKAAGQKQDPIYDLLWSFDRRRESLEQDRLLYVAITRARKRLHLFAQLQRQEADGSIVEPLSGSLLQRLWPEVSTEPDVDRAGEIPVRTRSNAWQQSPEWTEVCIARLATEWRLPVATQGSTICREVEDTAQQQPVEYDWAGRTARQVGEIVHLWLQRIAADGLKHFDAAKIEQLQPAFRRMLRKLGTDPEQLDEALGNITAALINTVTDERGRWILSSEHQQAASEYSMTVASGARYEHVVLDRTFVTAGGERWIIDYKTSSHEGGDLEAFLESETSRYLSQLQRYTAAMAEKDNLPIRAALYFPLLKIFHEVPVDGSK